MTLAIPGTCLVCGKQINILNDQKFCSRACKADAGPTGRVSLDLQDLTILQIRSTRSRTDFYLTVPRDVLLESGAVQSVIDLGSEIEYFCIEDADPNSSLMIRLRELGFKDENWVSIVDAANPPPVYQWSETFKH